MYEAKISIKAQTQQQLEYGLSVLSVDLNDTDLREGGYKSEFRDGRPEFGGEGLEVRAVFLRKGVGPGFWRRLREVI